MPERQMYMCPRCGSANRNCESIELPMPAMSLPRRPRNWLNVPMNDRPEPREWR
jgi:hypothetical protein